ncbi:MAG: bacteriohopanetetrol glucosamine biosynthesis glycosyltransferase HpnI [Acidobacteriia bacterium]|nr:bacteriohopanetetrol glucosamine biosynthesis glycosyltransferase HpnI [Terriglobia bacterium]
MIWLAVPGLAAGAYYVLTVIATIRWGARRGAPGSRGSGTGTGAFTPISLLKPVHGRDPRFFDAIRSHALQDYPEFEILFGVSDPRDSALEDIARLQREFPSLRIESVVVSTTAPNAKAGVLAELARRARYPLLVVNDSDIVVEPGYLRAVAAPLANPGTGLVTCLYRAAAASWASRAEALGIATEFVPSVLVARLLGQGEFALGSTMALRADTLRAAGGFEAIAQYLADDYQLGRRVHALGGRIEFAPVVVTTDLGAESWAGAWGHQLRWARTIRISRPGGYYGYAITHATVWALVALAAGEWRIAAAVLGVRLIAGALTALVIGDCRSAAAFWAVPLRDLFGFAVWLGGAFGRTVHWRGRQLRLSDGGVISEKSAAALN